MTIAINSSGSTSVAADVIGAATPPASGQQIQYAKLDLGANGASQPVVGSLPVSDALGTKTTRTLTVSSSTPAQIVAANASRKELTVYNAGPSPLLTGGADLASPAGVPIPANAIGRDTRSRDAWFGYVSSGSAVLTILETS